MQDTKFYWNSITKELVGNLGTCITREFLETNAMLVDKRQLGWSLDYPSIYFFLEPLLVGWDPISDVPISVINAETQNYLYMSQKAHKGAKDHAKLTGEPRWTEEKFQRELNPKYGRMKRLKRKLRKWKRRR